MSAEFGTGKTVLVLAIVVGCFAVLWPKVFYPLLVSTPPQQAANFQDETPMRGERPPRHISPEMLHPALREKTRGRRTIDAQARPGPMPGVRPPMGGGGGHMAGPQQAKGGQTMSIIMPLYTVGIIVFFIYTIFKVVVKKCPEEQDTSPRIKDFHLDPEQRKYVFAEEYVDQRRERRRTPSQPKAAAKPPEAEPEPEPKIDDEQMEALRRRLEDTERAMERLMSQMGSVSDKLTAARVGEVLAARQQADQAGISSTPMCSKGSTPDMDEYEVVNKDSPTYSQSADTQKDKEKETSAQEGAAPTQGAGLEEVKEPEAEAPPPSEEKPLQEQSPPEDLPSTPPQKESTTTQQESSPPQKESSAPQKECQEAPRQEPAASIDSQEGLGIETSLKESVEQKSAEKPEESDTSK